MMNLKDNNQQRFKVTLRSYQKLKEEYSTIRKEQSCGELNSNYGKKWSEEQKREASERQKKNLSHLKGDNNPSKRQKVREKIRGTKLGSSNPRYKEWELINPDGKVLILEGGYRLDEYLTTLKFTRAMFYKKEDNYMIQKDGWKLRSI